MLYKVHIRTFNHASLEATLVWNYNTLDSLLTGATCRATSLSKKHPPKRWILWLLLFNPCLIIWSGTLCTCNETRCNSPTKGENFTKEAETAAAVSFMIIMVIVVMVLLWSEWSYENSGSILLTYASFRWWRQACHAMFVQEMRWIQTLHIQKKKIEGLTLYQQRKRFKIN